MKALFALLAFAALLALANAQGKLLLIILKFN